MLLSGEGQADSACLADPGVAFNGPVLHEPAGKHCMVWEFVGRLSLEDHTQIMWKFGRRTRSAWAARSELAPTAAPACLSFSCASWSRRRKFLSISRITCKPSHTSALTRTDKQHLRLGQPATAIHRSMLEGDKFANNTGSVRLNTGQVHLTGRSAPRHRQVDKHEGWISGPGVACFFRRHGAASKRASSDSGRSCWLAPGSRCSGHYDALFGTPRLPRTACSAASLWRPASCALTGALRCLCEASTDQLSRHYRLVVACWVRAAFPRRVTAQPYSHFPPKLQLVEAYCPRQARCKPLLICCAQDTQ